MSPRAEAVEQSTRYPLRFGTAAFVLISITLVLVLVVLPQRYVLSTGFRESGMSFPNPTTPFLPVAAAPVSARALPIPAGVTISGSAPAFWEDVTALFDAGQYGAAVPVFERYLERNPADADARRELAVTLLAAGRTAEGLQVLRALLSQEPDAELRLLLARTLRDVGRISEASSEYAALARARPNDDALTLEWARAHSWVGENEAACEILSSALLRRPASGRLRVELARVYYSLDGRLRDAIALLATMDPDALAEEGGSALWDDAVGSLFVVPQVVSLPARRTPLDGALAARSAGDFGRARSILEGELARRPGDPDLWMAYANLLEYELGDFEGARSALLEAERIGPANVAVQLRLAQLDVWTGRNADAVSRLEGLAVTLEQGVARSSTGARADALALLGDLRRWEGDRILAAGTYERALDADPDNRRARDGLAALHTEVAQQLVQLEDPHVAGTASSRSDSDEFARVDAGGEWAALAGDDWVWGGAVGERWLGGFDLAGLDASRNGVYLDLEAARWWRWATLRTGLHAGVERVGGASELRLGASVRHRARDGSDTELRFEHGPAHPLANTLQSLLANVSQDRLTLTHARRLGEPWSLGATADAARLRASASGAGGTSDRLQVALSIGRPVTGSLTAGLGAGAVTFTEAAQVAGPGSRPLFWDPRIAVSASPYASLEHELSRSWMLTGRLAPGVALMDERRPVGRGLQLVPQIALETGVRHEGARLWTALEAFYSQGQFDGYRTYGARLTVGARRRSASGRAR